MKAGCAMNINGLKCLLENIIDESADLSKKSIRAIEIINIMNNAFLRITFCDKTEKLYKLYEKGVCDD